MTNKLHSRAGYVDIVEAACHALRNGDLGRTDLAQRVIAITGTGTQDAVMFELRHGVLRGLISRPAPGTYHLTKLGWDLLRDLDMAEV